MMLQPGTGDSTGAGPGNPARDADGSGPNEQVGTAIPPVERPVTRKSPVGACLA